MTVKIVRLTVSPELVSPDGSYPPALHWVLKKIPTEDDVLIKDPQMKDSFLQALKVVNARQAYCKVPVVDKVGKTAIDKSCIGFLQGITANMKPELTFNTMLKQQPKAGAASLECDLEASYSPPNPPPKMESLCILAIAGDPGQLVTCTEERSHSVIVRLVDLAAQYHLGVLPASLPDITIQTMVVPGQPSAGNWPSEATTIQLQSVAVEAFKLARNMNVIPPAGPSLAEAGKLETQIRDRYLIQRSNWPEPRVTLGPMFEPEAKASVPYQLTIRNLHLVERARIVLNPGKDLNVEEESNPVIEKLLQKASGQVEQHLQDALKSLAGTIPSNQTVGDLTDLIQRDSQVAGTITPTCVQEGGLSYLQFEGPHRWVIGLIDGTLNAGIAADAHQLFSGEGKVTETHVLSRFESATLSVHAGPAVQNADFSIALQNTRTQLTYGFVLDTLLLRDQNQRFGYLAGPKFVREEYGSTPKLFAEFSRPWQGRSFSIDARLEAAWQFHHLLISPPDGYPLLPEDASPEQGWVSGLAPTASLLMGYDFAHSARADKLGGIGKVFVSLGADALRARKFAGGDLSFSRYRAHGKAEAFLGITGRQDFAIRYNRGFSTSSSGTPLFELPELGGSENIRGIEEGEFVGRRIVFDQSEVGVNAESVWRWLRRRQPPSSQTAAAALDHPQSLLAGLGLDSIFIFALYDRARVMPASSFTSLFDLQHAFHGNGVEAEFRGLHAGTKTLNLGAIYSLAGASILHRKGTFTTSVSIDF